MATAGSFCDLSLVTGLFFQQVNCSDFASNPQDPVELTTTGNSGLSCTGGQHHYNWKTTKSQAGKCYQLILRFNDGSQYTADFSLK